MKWLMGMIAFALLLTEGRVAEPVGEVFRRSPTYYAVRYGSPDSTVESERWAFLHPGTDGFTEVPGEFSMRRFGDRKGKVTIEAVFFRPHLGLAAVTIGRPGGWTPADVHALLGEYGARWRQLGPAIWVSEEGVRAIHRDGRFHLLSPRIVGEMDAVRFGRR